MSLVRSAPPPPGEFKDETRNSYFKFQGLLHQYTDMEFRPRPSQEKAASVAIRQNTIINMRTGGGKTLIAVMVIDHFLKSNPTKKVMFLVPSRALVYQQAEYLRKCCSPIQSGFSVSVSELCGQDLEGWDQALWLGTIERSHILVGTSEVFRRALVDRGFIASSQFSLIVFDECHNAVGNSPMAALLKDSVLRSSTVDRPHILGLTASFDNGAVSPTMIVKKRQKLEALFQANIYSPEEGAEEAEAGAFDEKSMDQVAFHKEDNSSFRPIVVGEVELVFRGLPMGLFNEKEHNKWVEKGFNVFEGVGAEGLRFWLREGVVQQLMASAEALGKMTDDAACQNKSKYLKRSLLPVQRKLSNVTFSSSLGLPQYSQQCISLLKLLWSLYKASLAPPSSDSSSLNYSYSGKQSAGAGGGSFQPNNVFRGIIFVEQIAFTYPIAYIVNSFFDFLLRKDIDQTEGVSLSGIPNDLTDDEMMTLFFFYPRSQLDSDSNTVSALTSLDEKWTTALPVSGSSSMEDSTRECHLTKFRRGEIPLLVSTNALEEGIDVPDCSLIIRYDAINTTKAHIQGSGRARCRNARVYYFKNDPAIECAKAKTLQDIARDHRLNLTEGQLDSELRRMQIVSVLNSSLSYRTNTDGSVTAMRITYPFRAAEFHAQRDLGLPLPRSTTAPPLPPQQASATDSHKGRGEVHLFNCMPIFYEYVNRVAGQSVTPEALFDILTEEGPGFPPMIKKTLAAVLYPTPDGMQRMEIAQVNAIWGDKRVDEVLVSDRNRLVGLGILETETRRAIFCVILHLHELGLLDVSNEPTQKALAVTPGSIPLIVPTDTSQTIRNKYSHSSLGTTEQFKINFSVGNTEQFKINFTAAATVVAEEKDMISWDTY